MPTPLKAASILAWCCLAIVLAGCRNSLSTQYGLSDGSDARYSPASVSLFRNLCIENGKPTIVVRSFSPRAMTRLKAIVWSPDSFEPHDPAALLWIDRWLSSGERTLVYVGRDFSPTADYWAQAAGEFVNSKQTMKNSVYAREQQAVELATLDKMRSRVRSNVVTPWCVFDHSTGNEEKVTNLKGPWAESTDATKTRLFVRSYPVPYSAESLASFQDELDWQPKDTGVKPANTSGYELSWQDSDAKMLKTVKLLSQEGLPNMESLLATHDDRALISECTSPRWGKSRVIVLSNSSLISNLSLITPENLGLAKKLIDKLPNQTIGFLAGSMDPPVRKDDFSSQQKGFEMLTMWPLNVISLHAVFLGMLVLLAAFPIFGRAKRLPAKSTREFSQHIEAVGGLLAKSQDRSYALATLAEYFRVVRKEPTSPWANLDPMIQQEPTSPFQTPS